MTSLMVNNLKDFYWFIFRLNCGLGLGTRTKADIARNVVTKIMAKDIVYVWNFIYFLVDEVFDCYRQYSL